MAKVFTITEGLENMGALRTGGQGSVYKGRRIGPILTAVKLLPTPIHSEDENDKNFRDFQNEVAKLRKVNEEPNPNVVKILTSGITESGSLPFIEMEFIEGPDLEELLKPPHDPVFAIRDAIKVADQLSNALAHCHKFGVKHGDIKSNNVKLNVHSGNYMLLDFGLSVMSDEQRRTSLRNAGAIEFMAPEQNTGQMYFATDVYSFGVILFELLAGVVPFPLLDNGETARNAVMVSHMELPVPDLLDLRKKHLPATWSDDRKEREMIVPDWLIQVITKCLEKKPENRFKDGVELHETICLNITSAIDKLHTNENNLEQLKKENEELKALLWKQQQGNSPKLTSPDNIRKERDGGTWRSSSGLGGLRPVVLGLAILLSSLGIFAGFSMFNSRSYNSQVIDTAALNAEKQRLRDSIETLKAINDQRRQDSIDYARRYAALRQKMEEKEQEEEVIRQVTESEKKRRKLFNIKLFKKKD